MVAEEVGVTLEDASALSLSLFRELMVFLYLKGESVTEVVDDVELLSPPMLSFLMSDVTSDGLTATASVDGRRTGRLTIGTIVSGILCYCVIV